MFDFPSFGGGLLGSQTPGAQPSMGLMDPRTQGLLGLSAALLQASGPSSTPVGLGQVIGRGFMGGLQGYGAGLQYQRQATQDKLLNAKLTKEIGALDALKNFNKSPASNAAAGASADPTGLSDSSAASIDAPWAASSQIPQQAPAPKQLQVPDFQGLLAAGVPADTVKALMEDWKLRNPEMQVNGGYAYNPRSIGQGFIPQVKISDNGQAVGLTPNSGGGLPSVAPLPGAVGSYTQFRDADERAKAAVKPFLGVIDSQGRPIPMTELDFADKYGPKPQTQSLPSIDPIIPTGFAATEADALKRVQDAAAKGETATITVDPTKAGGMGMSSPQKTALDTAAQGDATRVQTLEAKIPSLLSVQRRLDRMEALTRDDKTFSAAGSELKVLLGSISQSFGLNVDKAKTANSEEYLANVAELLKDRLSSKDYGSGTGISNLDMLSAQKPLPELAKTAQGRLQLIQALRSDAQSAVTDAQAARDYFDSNSGLRGFRFPSEVQAEQQKKTDDLKRISSPGAQPAPTGKVLRYNPATKRIE